MAAVDDGVPLQSSQPPMEETPVLPQDFRPKIPTSKPLVMQNSLASVPRSWASQSSVPQAFASMPRPSFVVCCDGVQRQCKELYALRGSTGTPVRDDHIHLNENNVAFLMFYLYRFPKGFVRNPKTEEEKLSVEKNLIYQMANGGGEIVSATPPTPATASLIFGPVTFQFIMPVIIEMRTHKKVTAAKHLELAGSCLKILRHSIVDINLKKNSYKDILIY